MMPFELIVAFRYLRAKRKQAVVSVITGVAVLGVMAGVAALVIALAMNTGFRQDLQAKLLGAQPHITLLKPDGTGISGYMEIVARVRAVPGVVAAEPAIHLQVLLDNGFRQRGAYLKGIIPELAMARTSVLDHLEEGSMDDFGQDSLIVGHQLAGEMGSFLGDEIEAASAQTVVSPMGSAPRRLVFDVDGIFNSGLFEYDSGYAFASLERVQRLGGLGDVVTEIQIQIADADQTEVVGPLAAAAAGGDIVHTDWKRQNANVFQALQLERLAMWIAIGLIVFVASLNIVGALVMMVMEKARDVAVLMAMGATRRQIRRIFVAQGMIIGLAGTVLGLLVGNLAAYYADAYQWISLAEDVWSIDHVPFDPRWMDSVVVGAAALAVSFVATLYPSRAASSLDPVEAIRYE
jgi:lipoprotein-releasing system permease protein